MALKEACGKKCCDCEQPCSLDEQIPCSPDCENLTTDGKINVRKCLENGCDTVRYIFDSVKKADEEIIDEYGEIANFPYSMN